MQVTLRSSQAAHTKRPERHSAEQAGLAAPLHELVQDRAIQLPQAEIGQATSKIHQGSAQLAGKARPDGPLVGFFSRRRSGRRHRMLRMHC